MTTWTIEHADVLDWTAGYKGESFHALLCDPPYEYGFMGKSWDDSGVSYRAEVWAALAEHLCPGAFVMAFGGARTYHRLAVAMEDAGLRIHPAMGWLQAQGFPKATRVGRNGNHSEFEGHRYGLQAIKPSLEFLALAQKPYEGKPVDCIMETGAGALWIDGGRVGTNDVLTGSGAPPLQFGGDSHRPFHDDAEPKGCNQHPSGRWPANFILTCECSQIDWCDCDDEEGHQ